jgi:siroheme synthase-like protein
MLFPLFVKFDAKPCLVVGGGEIAARKARALLEAGGKVTVVAKEVSECVMSLEGVAIIERAFEEADVESMTLVVAATGDENVDGSVSATCQKRGIPVNCVDQPENSTFFFPAVVRHGETVAAFSSGGKCPVAASLMRDKFSRSLPKEFFEKVAALSERREEMVAKFPEYGKRAQEYRKEFSAWTD